MIKPLFITLFLFCLCHGHATDCRPWLGNYYEFELRSNLNTQCYAWLSSDLAKKNSGDKKYSSSDIFLNLSLANAIPDPDIGLEFEITEARTRRQQGKIDQLKLTGRYLWLDDVVGDPCSLITGLSYIQAFENSLKDVSSFHHGLYNTEFFISLGRENPDGIQWGSRWWGVFAFGLAEQGSPWFRIRLDYDKRWWDKHEMGLFMQTLWGMGNQPLRLKDFEGYGPIKHQSIDLGVRYVYEIDYYGHASLEYSYRVHAKNFPAYTQSILAQILYNFGL